MGFLGSLAQGIASAGSIVSNISGIADTVAGFFGNSSADKARDDAWAKQKWLLDYASPLKERARLEAAGLNPALMYAKGAGGGMPSMPNIEPSRKASDNQASADAFAQLLFRQQEINLREQELDMRRDDTESRIEQRAQQIAESRYKTDNLLPQTVSESQSREQLNYTRGNEIGALQPARLENLRASTSAVIEQAKKTRAEIDYVMAQTDNTRLRNFEQQLRNSKLDERLKLEMMQLRRNISNEMIRGNLTNQQAISAYIKNYVDMRLAPHGLNSSDSGFNKMLFNLRTDMWHWYRDNQNLLKQ